MPDKLNNLMNIGKNDYYAYNNYSQLQMEKSFSNVYVLNPESYMLHEHFRDPIGVTTREQLDKRWQDWLFFLRQVRPNMN